MEQDNGNNESSNTTDNGTKKTNYEDNTYKIDGFNDEVNISIQEESPEDTYITIHDLNTIEQMNPAQLNIGTNSGTSCPKQQHTWQHKMP